MLQDHGSDFGIALFAPDDLTDYIIQFVATLDPNGASGSASNRTIAWPRYEPATRRMLVLREGEGEPLSIGRDDAREEAMEFVAALSLKYPL